MSSRLGLRFLHTFRQTYRQTAQSVRQNAQTFRTTFQRGYADGPTSAAGPEQSKFKAFLSSPIGPKTVHFWAPVMKWGLVIAGAADFARPPEKLSLSQNAALSCTGLIWTRWCFIIKPKNLFLASVNFLVACVGLTQVSRILLYQQSLKNTSVSTEAAKAAESEAENVKAIVRDPKGAVEQAKKGI